MTFNFRLGADKQPKGIPVYHLVHNLTFDLILYNKYWICCLYKEYYTLSIGSILFKIFWHNIIIYNLYWVVILCCRSNEVHMYVESAAMWYT